jgi:transcriptional regulator with XRE-family HTH domain
MSYDYSMLLGRIKECGFTQETLSQKIKINESTLNLKLNNKASFKQNEIKMICNVLNIGKDEIGVYFFREKV